MCASISCALVLTGCTNQIPGTPTPVSATAYSCQARAVTGQTYTQFRLRGQPFSASIPKLPGWRSAPTALTENQLALTKAIGNTRGYIALSTLRPELYRNKALTQLDKLTKFDSSVSIVKDKTVNVCGREASRLTGIAEKRGLRFEYLNLIYPFDGNYYPVQLRAQMSLSDSSLFGAEVETMFRNLQIGP